MFYNPLNQSYETSTITPRKITKGRSEVQRELSNLSSCTFPRVMEVEPRFKPQILHRLPLWHIHTICSRNKTCFVPHSKLRMRNLLQDSIQGPIPNVVYSQGEAVYLPTSSQHSVAEEGQSSEADFLWVTGEHLHRVPIFPPWDLGFHEIVTQSLSVYLLFCVT